MVEQDTSGRAKRDAIGAKDGRPLHDRCGRIVGQGAEVEPHEDDWAGNRLGGWDRGHALATQRGPRGQQHTVGKWESGHRSHPHTILVEEVLDLHQVTVNLGTVVPATE